MTPSSFSARFVEFIPDQIDEGVIYISTRFATASHHCACGCGTLVVTPIRRGGWRLTWDGEDVSLYPSIGNWNLKCRSHYWITNNTVEWASKWNNRQIETSRKREIRAKRRYYEKKNRRTIFGLLLKDKDEKISKNI